MFRQHSPRRSGVAVALILVVLALGMGACVIRKRENQPERCGVYETIEEPGQWEPVRWFAICPEPRRD